MNAFEPPADHPEPAGPTDPAGTPDRPAATGSDGAYQPASSGRGWLARSTMPIGLGLIILGAAACDPPGETVRAFDRDGIVHVIGTDGPDAIALRLAAADPTELQVDVGADGTADFTFDLDVTTGVFVRGWGGDDTIAVDPASRAFTDTRHASFLGGAGDDTLIGSVGAQHLEGGPGADVIDGHFGDDTIIGGDGDDTFPWVPGSGSDTVTGGAGSDRSVVDGSGAAETFQLGDVDGHAVLTRDVASVTLDLDAVESLDLRTYGAADVLRAGDVSGTDLVTVTTDFAAPGGGDDGAVDRVDVPVGVALGRDGSAATVDGLGARYRVVNGTGADQVHVVGTAGADVQQVVGTAGADTVSVTANGTDVAVFGATGSLLANLTAVEALDVDLGGGTDSFSAVGNLAALIAIDVHGGEDADSILGSNGADVLDGGGGPDFVDGQQGVDTVLGSAGADTVQWDPGDGSDVIVGGAGVDRLSFNGSSADEIYSVTAVGDHARFTRNLANIVLDLDEVEAIDVRALGGADQLGAGDVTGTDLTTVTADFSGTFGGVSDDGAVDRLLVPRGVALGSDGVVGTVGGLGAQYRVVNPAGADQINVVGTGSTDPQPIVGTPGADTVNVTANGTDVAVMGVTGQVLVNLTAIHALDVDLGDGADSFSAVGNIAALATLDVDGGPGADTILGSNGADLLAGGEGPDFLDGQQGIDQPFGGDGDDIFQWDPGDGTDSLEGGAGTDRLVFNGSNGNENFEVSSIGDRVRFTRDLASIVLGFDDIEALDVRALGGTDLLRVHDLSPTDLATVTADLGLFGGGDDGAQDRVMVPVGVNPGLDGSTPVVDGLGAQVRVVNGTTSDWIHIAGTGGFDTQSIFGGAGAETVSATANGTDVAVFGFTGPMLVNLSAVEVLDVNFGDGDDSFSATGNLAALITVDVDGDLGDDTILGSNGADFLTGGPGNDFVDGQQGVDDVDGGAGDDTFQWDPGDGSDVLVGGADTDRMVFNGSSIGELFEASNVGGHVRFTRNIGTIVLDLDDIEALDVRAMAGTDTLTVQDLTGTDLTEITADLATFGGIVDGVMDQVVVNGTPGDDAIDVLDDGDAVEVHGLKATVRITGADPTLDHLFVNGLEGADTITPTPGAWSLMQLVLMP